MTGRIAGAEWIERVLKMAANFFRGLEGFPALSLVDSARALAGADWLAGNGLEPHRLPLRSILQGLLHREHGD